MAHKSRKIDKGDTCRFHQGQRGAKHISQTARIYDSKPVPVKNITVPCKTGGDYIRVRFGDWGAQKLIT